MKPSATRRLTARLLKRGQESAGWIPSPAPEPIIERRQFQFASKAQLRGVLREHNPRINLVDWLKSQPASTRRGVARGNFVLPAYVVGRYRLGKKDYALLG